MNEALGARGTTFDLIEPVAHEPLDQARLVASADRGHAGRAGHHLLIIDSNPVFTAPASWGFAEALARVPFSLALAGSADETARSTTWFVPQDPRVGDLERCARLRRDRARIMQPQALPLYGGVSAHEMIGALSGAAPLCRLSRP